MAITKQAVKPEETFRSTDPNTLISEYINNYQFDEEAELKALVKKLKSERLISIDYTAYRSPEELLNSELIPERFVIARTQVDRVYVERLISFTKKGFELVDQGDVYVPSGAVKFGTDPTKRTVYLKTPSKHLQTDAQLEEIAKDKLAPIAEAHKKAYFDQNKVAKWLEQTIADHEQYNAVLRQKQIQTATAAALDCLDLPR